MSKDPGPNILYYGDNLDILQRYGEAESVDLVYLDPPFKSNQDYNVLFAEKNGSQSAAQIRAFEDTWRWDQGAAAAYEDVVEHGGKVAQAMVAFRTFLGDNDMMAYLAMMAPRLLELRRVLKKTGSIYLHCDPTASHYLKILMDSIFGGERFVNEIVWHYRKWPAGKYTFQRNHDIILFYACSSSTARTFNQLYMSRAASTLKRFGKAKIISGHDEKGRRVPSQMADEESGGVRQDDVWEIGRVPPIKQLFPTEKPLPLLERIILASSNEGDLVLDPFCGCGTTITAAQHLKRRWIGIDITHLAISLMKHRLSDAFGDNVKYEVIGEPADLAGAAALADEDPYQFQFWALGLVGARPTEEKKGADRGVDGRLYFHDEKVGGKTKQIVFSIKSGKLQAQYVRDLRGVVEREKAAIGVLISLDEPTKPMRREAASAGLYQSPAEWGGKTKYPRLQLITIEELLSGKNIDCPPRHQTSVTFKKAPKAKRKEAENLDLFEDGEE
jgi:site-specific DNA-methyltransferase (adenine-specific)